MKRIFKNDLVIVLAGEAGQGIQSIESTITLLLKRNGYNVFSASEFMSRVRGGSNSTELRIASKAVASYCERIDILIPLHNGSIKHLKKRITPDTIVIGDASKIEYDGIRDIQFNKIALEAGNVLYANTVAAGVICGLLNLDQKVCESFIYQQFASKSQEIGERNADALRRGYSAGSQFTDIEIVIEDNESVKNDILLSGAESVALGALAGGCNYVCGYPMSPSTSVLEKMAFYSGKFDIIVEQVEDEVGVVNMALGAWYAGARAFVTTSGGGFALMCEGISLCGMIESPLVIHLAQRPGPATGLPTRTEQGDLNLALYAGHGDFPRIILAPGTLDDGYMLTKAAFDLSDKYQVPVFILTDQYFVDSRYNTAPFTVTNLPENHIVETDDAYKRFALTKSGISPRGIPGYGSGMVCADSDEHDESGHITEDLELRVKMVDKRMRKEVAIHDAVIEPEFFGNASCSTLVICWGSTFHMVNDAVRSLDNDDIGVLHYSWIYPLPKCTSSYLGNASKVIVVENNGSAQFAKLIQRETGYVVTNNILKYDGLPFTVEELAQKIRSMI